MTIAIEVDDGAVEHTPSSSRRRKKRYDHWARLDPKEFIAYSKSTQASYGSEARLIEKAQQGDIEARNEVWVRHAPLVLSVVKSYPMPRDILPDAIQEGMLGLNRALEKFEVNRYLAFSTYAWRWVAQRIKRFLARSAHRISIPSPLHGDYYRFRQQIHACRSSADIDRVLMKWAAIHPSKCESLYRLFRILSAASIHDLKEDELPCLSDEVMTHFEELSGPLASALDTLKPRHRDIIMHRYGLFGCQEMTLEQLGERCEITHERVRQIQVAAEKRLAEHLFKFRMDILS